MVANSKTGFFFLRHADIQWHRVTYAAAYHNTSPIIVDLNDIESRACLAPLFSSKSPGRPRIKRFTKGSLQQKHKKTKREFLRDRKSYQWNNYLGDEVVLTQSEEEAYEKETKAAVRKRSMSATTKNKAKRCKIDDRINDSEASFDIEHNSKSSPVDVPQGRINSASTILASKTSPSTTSASTTSASTTFFGRILNVFSTYTSVTQVRYHNFIISYCFISYMNLICPLYHYISWALAGK